MNNKVHSAVTAEKTVLGFRPADLLGILIMIIPCVISYCWQKEIPIKILGFIDIKKTETINIWPNMVTAIFAVAFYAALIIRFDFFKSNNLGQAIISSIRTFLDCWVLASLLSIVIPTKEANSSIFANMFQSTQLLSLLFAVVLTWLGMKSVAGYGWIVFIIAAAANMMKVNNAFERLGAVFIITAAISLFLQVKDLTNIKDFISDFKVGSNKYTSQVRGSINSAVYDAANQTYVVTDYVKKSIGKRSSSEPYVPHLTLAPDDTRTSSKDALDRNMPQNRGVKIDYEALDINKDGVIDEKDLLLMQEMRNKK